MTYFYTFLDFLLHIDRYLGSIISSYGWTTYLILFVVIFIETGLVVTPFLPGDSLLFTAGAFAAIGSLNIEILFLLCAAAAILGDAVNYLIGKKLGHALFMKEKVRFIKKEYLEKTIRFFERHGGKTIAIARFIPIIRTFAPFVAGAGQMKYRRFLLFNAVGGLLWTALFTFGGYFFGNLPVIREHFSLVIIGIVLISLLPPLLLKIKSKFERKKASEK